MGSKVKKVAVREIIKDDFGPVCIIQDQAELDKLLDWWQKKLFLMDWIIKASIVSKEDFDLEDSLGECIMCVEQKAATIHLLDSAEFPKDTIVRLCHEKTLVHELLHCIYNILQGPETYEARFLDVMEHSQLESMSRSLIMTKYDLTPDWFKNF